MTRRYLGIDPGLRCGYAVLDATGRWITSGSWDLRPSRLEGAGMRWVRLERNLVELVTGQTVGGDDVALGYEAVLRHLGSDAAHVYGGIVATVQRACEALPCPYLGLHYATVKRAATGRGNANKEQMIAAARRQWPQAAVGIHDDDQADALWVAETLRRQLTIPTAHPQRRIA